MIIIVINTGVFITIVVSLILLYISLYTFSFPGFNYKFFT